MVRAKQAEWDKALASHQSHLSVEQKRQEDLRIEHEELLLHQADEAQRKLERQLREVEGAKAVAVRERCLNPMISQLTFR